MNGRMRSFKLNQKYWDTPEPITPDKLPNMKINLLALSKYAEERGKNFPISLWKKRKCLSVNQLILQRDGFRLSLFL